MNSSQSEPKECDICLDLWSKRKVNITRELFNCVSPCVYVDHLENNTCYTNWEDVFDELAIYLSFNTCKYISIIIYVGIFAIGLSRNFLVCLVIYRKHHMRTVTNLFIFNLALSDFLVILVCLPTTLIEDMWESWYLGLVACKIIKFLQKTSVHVSVLTLTAIAVERYYAIVHPLSIKTSVSRACWIILAIWIAASIVSSPDLFLYSLHRMFPDCITDTMTTCYRNKSGDDRMVYQRIILVLFYLIPANIIGIAYGKIAFTLWSRNSDFPISDDERHSSVQLLQKRRIAKMLIVVAAMFFLCYLPHHVISELRHTTALESHESFATCLFLFVHVLVYLNSACNPFVYNFMSEKFRREFRMTFSCIEGKESKNKSSTISDNNEDAEKRTQVIWKKMDQTEIRIGRTVVTQIG